MTTLSAAAVPAYTAHASGLTRVGYYATVYGLALVFLWIGAMKFTAYEANAIQGLVASSPFVSWLYGIFDVRGAANLIGSVEVATGLLLVARPFSTRAGAVGAALAAVTTVVTLSFLFTAPGWEASLGGFPALSVVPGQFLLKDVVLFGASLYLLGDALSEVRD